MQKFCYSSYCWRRHARLVCMSKQRLSWRCLQSSSILVYFYPSFYLWKVLFLSRIEPFFKAFSRIWKLFSRLEHAHQNTFFWITTTHLVGSAFGTYTLKNSVALVRERTIPTERPPPVGEVSANFCGWTKPSFDSIPTAINAWLHDYTCNNFCERSGAGGSPSHPSSTP
jgi:hypothetical protein